METLKYILIKLVDWKTRQRKIQYLIMLLGAGMLSANKYLGQSLTLQKGDLQFALSLSEGNIITDYLVNIAAIFIILGGFIWLIIDAYQEAKITVRKKVVVIEGRGLRKVMTTPLHKTAAKHFTGKIARGAKRIHIVLAAPSSIALNFGRRYDNRNLAQALVYQYEKDHAITYPWAVEIPGHGKREGSVLMTSKPAGAS
ncbi:MAG: SAVED domain-containing protein [Serratia proteamaculans]